MEKSSVDCYTYNRCGGRNVAHTSNLIESTTLHVHTITSVSLIQWLLVSGMVTVYSFWHCSSADCSTVHGDTVGLAAWSSLVAHSLIPLVVQDMAMYEG